MTSCKTEEDVVTGGGGHRTRIFFVPPSRLRVFENRVLRRTFGPKREEDGSWRKLYNDELHSL
jgi:hypothetical protein